MCPVRGNDVKNGDVIIKTDEEKRGFRKWWDERNKTQKKMIFWILGASGTLLSLLIIYFSIISQKTIICHTSECHSTALEILSYIDETQKPCDNFYRFACGTFLKNISDEDVYTIKSVKLLMAEAIQSDLNLLLEEPIEEGEFQSFNLAKKFYKACMNEEAIEKQGVRALTHLFKQIGGWPILEGDNWNSEKFNWRHAVRFLRNFGINFDFFFNVTVEVDKENPERYILGIHDKFFSPSDISPNSKVAFLDYMVDVAQQFDIKSFNLWKEQNDVLDFLLKLAKISEESRKSNRTKLYNPHTLAELQSEYPSIPWYEYLQGILGTAVTLTFNDIVTVSEPLYLKELERILLTTNKRILANFMCWHVVQHLINYLPSKILDKAYEYLGKVNGHYYRKPRWTVCVQATRDRLSSALNLAYIGRYFDDDTASNVTDLIRNVKAQFRRNLQTLNWLDVETKGKMVSTLLSSVEKIYSYHDLREIIEENSIYDDVEISEDRFFSAVLELDLIYWDLHYGQLRKPVTDDWVKTQAFLSELKVVYASTQNKLKFPLGLFRGIYYNKIRPNYMNYGLLGSVVAHQISHIFVEATGVTVAESKEAEAKLINWWSPFSLKRYTEKLRCLTRQYERFLLGEVDGVHANPLITRDEDIADLAGVKVAYDTYLELEWQHGREPSLPGLDYSPRQLFWISSALQFCSKYPVEYLKDKFTGNKYHHSPNEFRVNGPLQNLDSFSNDFGCSYGSFMNPNEKCHVW